MATAVEQPPKTGPFMKGSIIWEKKGPLPVWAWALILLGLVLAVSMWRRNKAASTAASTDVSNIPPNQAAPPVFIMPQGPPPNVTITVPGAPPGAGRPGPPKIPVPTNFRSTGPQWTDALELHWDAVPGASGYAIRDLGSGQMTDVAGGGTTGTMMRGLVHNGSYNLQIAAKNAAGAIGAWSATLSAHTKN